MHGLAVFGFTLLFVVLVVVLEYVIRHATMKGDPEQWAWDRWDTLTLIIAIVVGVLIAIVCSCKRRELKAIGGIATTTTWPSRDLPPLVASPAPPPPGSLELSPILRPNSLSPVSPPGSVATPLPPLVPPST